MNKVKIMNQIITVISVFVVFVSCGRKQETKVVVTTDSQQVDSIRLAKQTDSISLEAYQMRIRREVEIKEERKLDSIWQHRTDSLLKIVEYIKRNQNISIAQRIDRIRELDNSTGSGNVWINSNLYLHGIDLNDILANEIVLLLIDTNIVNYNIDSIFTSIGENIAATHSKDNRLSVVDFWDSSGGTSILPVNVFIWRDSVGKPQGFEIFEAEYGRTFFYGRIYKLNNTDRNLYMLEGVTKDTGCVFKGIELTAKGINFNPKLFKTEKGFSSVYFLGEPCGDEKDFYYSFDKETQIVKFANCGDRDYGSYSGILTTGTLTFNGKYFTEKLKKQKYDVNE